MTSDVRALRDRVETFLAEIDGLLVGVGQVPKEAHVNGQPAEPYAVIYASPGVLSSERYAGGSQQFVWTCQVTVASGDEDATQFFIGEVRDALTDVRLEPENRAAGLLIEVGDPGPIRRDDENLADVRWYSPLMFRHYTNRRVL